MTAPFERSWIVAAAVVVAIGAVGGYLIGSGAAIGKNDAEQARDESFRVAHDRAESRVFAISRKRGFATGIKRGRAAGERVGLREAIKFGGGEAATLMTEAEIAAAESAASAARSEISARQPNCGVVVRAPSWCPTSDELAGFRAAVRAAREAREAEEAQEAEDAMTGPGAGRGKGRSDEG